MRALFVIAICSIAHAQPVRRTPLVWHEPVIRDRYKLEKGWLLGAHATPEHSLEESVEVEAGYHITDRLLVRARFVTPAIEAAYAIGVGKMAIPEAILRAKLFVIAGTDGGGFALRTYPIVGCDWVTLELGVRANHVETEGFAAMSILFDPLGRLVRTNL